MESLQIANTHNILIQTPHVEGAECRVSDKGGRKWNLWETPGTVAVQEGHPPLVVICAKKGFKTSVLTINEHKEELLTIDGQRIDVSIYGDFPTKFPRLIPTAIKESAGFVQDPTGHISTTYPNTITVWMEPKKWESEEQMREWAFDREVEDRAQFINEEDAKSVDEKRKAKRRMENEIHRNQIHNAAKNLKKVINPAPAIEQGFKNTVKVLNPSKPLKNVIDNGVGNPGAAVEGGLKSLTPIKIGDSLSLNEKNVKKEITLQQRAIDDAAKAKKDNNKYPSLKQQDIEVQQYDPNAPEDLFGDNPYTKTYNVDEKPKYDENGNRITK